jgi:hypothetical protein
MQPTSPLPETLFRLGISLQQGHLVSQLRPLALSALDRATYLSHYHRRIAPERSTVDFQHPKFQGGQRH